MSRWQVAALALALTSGVVACTGGGDAASAPPTTTAGLDGSAGTAEPTEVSCGAPADPPPLDPPLRAVAADLTRVAALPPGPGHDRYRVACDNLGATSVLVPVEWDDSIPRPGDRPMSLLTVAADLSAPIEDEAVVTVGAARYVGDVPELAALNDNHARSQSEGVRSGDRAGSTIADACSVLDLEPDVEGPPAPIRYSIDDASVELRAYGDCGGDPRVWLLATTLPDGGRQDYTFMIGQALRAADIDALLRVLSSTEVDPRHVPGVRLPPLPSVPETA